VKRQELRRSERERIKNQKWFQNWTPSQIQFHKKMVSECVDEVEKITEEVLDSCYIAAMIESLDLSINKCIEVAKIANKNMNEVKEIIQKDGEMYFNMLKDEKLRSQIREEAKAMILQGGIMSTGVQQLRKSHNVPIKDLTIIWAEAKQEIKEIPNYANGEIKATLSNEGEYGFEVLQYTVTEKEIEESMKNVSMKVSKEDLNIKESTKLKIIEQTIKVQGEYGTYTKTAEGIKTENIFVKDKEDLKTYKKAVESEFDKGKEELNKKFEELQQERNKLNERANKNFNIIEEIGQVFNL